VGLVVTFGLPGVGGLVPCLPVSYASDHSPSGSASSGNASRLQDTQVDS